MQVDITKVPEDQISTVLSMLCAAGQLDLNEAFDELADDMY